MFSGSAKLSQSAAMQGLRVGAPIDLRTGYDLLTAEGRRKAMEVIERQQPKIIHMAPVCGPWSQMQNINDPSDTYQKRKKYLPMVEFCVRVALYQIEHGRCFIIENPATSKIWFTKCFQRLLMKHAVTYGTLDICAFGMRDPNGYYYYKPKSLLHNFPDGVLNPIFKRCSSKSKKDQLTFINHWKVVLQVMDQEQSWHKFIHIDSVALWSDASFRLEIQGLSIHRCCHLLSTCWKIWISMNCEECKISLPHLRHQSILCWQLTCTNRSSSTRLLHETLAQPH